VLSLEAETDEPPEPMYTRESAVKKTGLNTKIWSIIRGLTWRVPDRVWRVKSSPVCICITSLTIPGPISLKTTVEEPPPCASPHSRSTVPTKKGMPSIPGKVKAYPSHSAYSRPAMGHTPGWLNRLVNPNVT
jgi:hypothetical protein